MIGGASGTPHIRDRALVSDLATRINQDGFAHQEEVLLSPDGSSFSEWVFFESASSDLRARVCVLRRRKFSLNFAANLCARLSDCDVSLMKPTTRGDVAFVIASFFALRRP